MSTDLAIPILPSRSLPGTLAFYARPPKQGIPRMDAIENKPWGLREFALVDEDGNLLRVGQVT